MTLPAYQTSVSPWPGLILLVFGTLLLATGCDKSWYDLRAFDDLADETWVDSSEVPEEFNSRIYGVAMASAGPSGDGAGLFVAGRNDDGLANLRFDASGARQESVIAFAGVSNSPALNPLPSNPLVVGDPASSQIAIAMTGGGTPETPEQTIIVLIDAADVSVKDMPRIALAGAPTPDGLAFGTTGVAGVTTKNAVVLRGGLLTAVRDIAAPMADEPTCAHGREDGLSAVVADLDQGGNEEIAVAVRSAGSNGEVVIVEGSLISDAVAAAGIGGPCFEDGVRAPLLTLTAPDGASASFGAVMVAGNLNGTGGLDLVVADPEANAVHAYIDFNPTPISIAAPSLASGRAGDFGAALAVGDIDDDDIDELVIGAPGTTVDDAEGAGSAFVYQLGDQDFGTPVQFHDAQPESDQRFGQAVTVAPFGTSRAILAVGADQEVFTYFRTPISSDVRSGR